MATKHLYIMEDVAATLLHALLQADRGLALACVAELVDSGEHDQATRIVTFACILSDPETIPYGALFQKDLVSVIESFVVPVVLPSSSPPFSTHPPPPKHNAAEPTVHIPWTILPNGWTSNQAYQLWKTIQAAFKAGYWEKAWRLTRPLLADRPALMDLLHALHADFADLLETTDSIPLAERILMLIFAQANTHKHPHTSPNPIPSAKGRTFSISPDALALWQIQTKPISDMQGAPILIRNPNASQFWKELVKTYEITGKQTLVFPNDDALEEFYARYFPNDIPDEWSNAERQKSHGLATCPQGQVDNPWAPIFRCYCFT